MELARELDIDRGLKLKLAFLDQYYITTRCPNSLPGDVPYEGETRKQAENALRVSRLVIILAKEAVEVT